MGQRTAQQYVSRIGVAGILTQPSFGLPDWRDRPKHPRNASNFTQFAPAG
jgi:hypothetical protein